MKGKGRKEIKTVGRKRKIRQEDKRKKKKNRMKKKMKKKSVDEGSNQRLRLGIYLFDNYETQHLTLNACNC